MKKGNGDTVKRSRIVLVGFCAALCSVVIAVLAGLGSRLGWWHFSTGFIILRWAVYTALLSLVLSVLGAYLARPGRRRRGGLWAFFAIVISLSVILVPYSWLQTARSVPPIHDISTDTRDPPRFVAIVPLRKNAPNPVEYGGPEIATQQSEAYPDIEPLILSLSSRQAFDRALDVAKKMGWHVVAADADNGRIEATDTTFWFGFRDDIVIRIAPDHHATRIDVRSLSRVGRSDVGTNARRIRNFMKLMNNAD